MSLSCSKSRSTVILVGTRNVHIVRDVRYASWFDGNLQRICKRPKDAFALYPHELPTFYTICDLGGCPPVVMFRVVTQRPKMVAKPSAVAMADRGFTASGCCATVIVL